MLLSKIKDEFRSNKPMKALINDLNPFTGLGNLLQGLLPLSRNFLINGSYIYNYYEKWAKKKHLKINKNWISNRYNSNTEKNSCRIGESKDILLFNRSN